MNDEDNQNLNYEAEENLEDIVSIDQEDIIAKLEKFDINSINENDKTDNDFKEKKKDKDNPKPRKRKSDSLSPDKKRKKSYPKKIKKKGWK